MLDVGIVTDDPLHDRESEQRVLGDMMCKQDFVDVAISRLVGVSDVFFTMDHSLVYETIVGLRGDHESADALTVATRLEDKGDLNRAGGYDYLIALMKVSTDIDIVNSLFYCERIIDLAVRRGYRVLATKVGDMVVDKDHDLKNVGKFIVQSADKLDEQIHRDTIKTVSLADIMRTEYPKSVMAVPDLVPKGLVLMAGQAKAGKSYAMLNLAIGVAEGGWVWSAKKVDEPKNVLYIAYESDYDEFQERTIQITGADNIPENLHVMCMDEDSLNLKLDSSGIGRIADYVGEYDIGLVVVDTWQRARPDSSYHRGNAYERDSDLLAPVQTLAKTLGITLILVHHLTKGVDPENPFNDISGSAGFQAIPDAMMVMKREEDHNRLWIRARRMPDAEYGVTLDVEQSGVVRLFELDDNSRNTNVTPVNQQIIDVFAEHGVRTVAEIASLLGKTEDSVKQAVYRMVRDGSVERAGRGRFQLVSQVEFL